MVYGVLRQFLPPVIRWIQLDAGSSPTKLYLSTAKNGDTYLLEDAVHVRARVAIVVLCA